ncbi:MULTISPECIES: ABC transporter ATP-binding protein [Robertmurraya]|uniref:ATP-binding cassette domain-containing protein n=1 Tax=Robertmurraya beringensis TaxID=641660 RepID=A0ABV6KXV5_9BACI
MKERLLSIQNLSIKTKDEQLLLKDINLELNQGEMVALIGESGSGKSITARTVQGLLDSTMVVTGHVFYEDMNLLSLDKRNHHRLLGSEIGSIFQDYRGSFTPFIKVGKQMVEAIRSHYSISKKEAKELSLHVLEEIQLDSNRIFQSYPFQLSGGQVQRVAIGLALALKPKLLICDEITTALDVMTAEAVLDAIEKVRKETRCAVLFITHDLVQAYKRSDHIFVMQKGRIVEEGTPEQIRCEHQHPYTKELCSCLLSLPGERYLHTHQGVRTV